MPKQIVLTGMHRSGTSLAASLARHAGIDMGSELVPARRGNPRGYFEDRDFHDLQERILARQGLNPFFVSVAELVEPDADARAAAAALIARRSGKALWGWKDPRTCLFLDFWHELLPDPHYVFLYRHPVEVALSLLRRRQGWLDPLNGLRAWSAYNTSILNFYHSHSDRCLLWSISGLARSIGAAFDALSGRLGVDLRRNGLEELFHPEELRLGLCLPEFDWRVVIPEELDLFGRLEDAANIPAGPPVPVPEARLSEDSERGRELRELELAQVNEHLLYLFLMRAKERPGAAEEAEGIRRLAGQVQKLKVTLAEIERSRAWKLVRAYWGLADKVRSFVR